MVYIQLRAVFYYLPIDNLLANCQQVGNQGNNHGQLGNWKLTEKLVPDHLSSIVHGTLMGTGLLWSKFCSYLHWDDGKILFILSVYIQPKIYMKNQSAIIKCFLRFSRVRIPPKFKKNMPYIYILFQLYRQPKIQKDVLNYYFHIQFVAKFS